MKQLYTTLVAVFAIVQFSYGQNTSWSTTGNIGIGTTTPLSNINLQVEKTSAQPALMIGGGYSGSPRLQLYGLNADVNAWMGLGTDMAGGPYEHSIYFPTAPNGITGKLTIGDYNGTTYNTRMAVLNNGNVGIGAASPVYKLNISQDVTMNQDIDVAQFGISGSSDNAKRIVMGYDVNGAGFGYIKAGWYNHQWTNLSLQPNGGNVGIGTTSPDQKLTVNGTIHSKEVKVDTSIPVPDYVFEPAYKLPQLSELKSYLDANHHLPEIPSAAEMEKNGINLSEMNLKLLKKVEELTLYLIDKDKEIKDLKTSQQQQIDALKVQMQSVQKNLNR